MGDCSMNDPEDLISKKKNCATYLYRGLGGPCL